MKLHCKPDMQKMKSMWPVLACVCLFFFGVYIGSSKSASDRIFQAEDSQPVSLKIAQLPSTSTAVEGSKITSTKSHFEGQRINITTRRQKKMESILTSASSIEPVTRSSIETSNITKVLLYTYYRGGSSFLGDLFNNNPDVFYWFEPLAGVTDNWGTDVWSTTVSLTREWYYYTNGTQKYFTPDKVGVLTSTIRDILDCDLARVPMQIYLHFFMVKTNIWDKSIKMRPYKSCARAAASGDGEITAEAVRRCLPLLIEQCQRSPIRVVKTIRLRMDMMPEILHKVPGIKVIHQTRDPRGLLNSWWHIFHGTQPIEAEIDSRLLCSSMLFDFRRMKELSYVHRDTFCDIQYEELATSPLKTVGKIYLFFLKREISEDLYQWVWKSTHSEKDNGVIGTQRKNSADTAVKWRRDIKPEFMNFTMQHCKQTIQELGYDI